MMRGVRERGWGGGYSERVEGDCRGRRGEGGEEEKMEKGEGERGTAVGEGGGGGGQESPIHHPSHSINN